VLVGSLPHEALEVVEELGEGHIAHLPLYDVQPPVPQDAQDLPRNDVLLEPVGNLLRADASNEVGFFTVHLAELKLTMTNGGIGAHDCGTDK